MPAARPPEVLRPRVGISACLLGERVRFDGGHKREPSLVDALSPHVEWVSICPEAEAGFGVPRPPMRLETSPRGPRLVVIETGEDRTVAMETFSRARLAALETADLDGYVLKARSPSCGLRDVPVVAPGKRAPAASASGLFARALLERFPDLPVADEDELRDPAARDRFLARVLNGRRSR